MTEKQRGMADVTLVAWVDSPEAVGYLAQHFGQRARQLGTLTVDKPITQPADTGGLFVWLRYRHTAKNRGNHDWDAQRFFARTMEGTSHRSHLYRAELNTWEPT
jgi:hypothetical protein